MKKGLSIFVGFAITAAALSYFGNKRRLIETERKKEIMDQVDTFIKNCLPKPEFDINLSSSHKS